MRTETEKKESAIIEKPPCPNCQTYNDFLKTGHPLMSPRMALPIPSDYPSYSEYSSACVLYVEAISYGPARTFASGLCGGSMWSAFMNPEWPETWTDKPWDKQQDARSSGRKTRGPKPRSERIQEMCTVYDLRFFQKKTYGQIAIILGRNRASSNASSPKKSKTKITPERVEGIYKDAVELTDKAHAQDFEWISKKYPELGTPDDIKNGPAGNLANNVTQPDSPTYLT